MITPSLDSIKSVISSKGYKIFGGDGNPYHLNIGGIRDSNAKPNSFGDTIYVFYTDENGTEQLHTYPATTVPGQYWLENPMRVEGTFVMKEGQYVGCWKSGLHKGEYPALIQVGNLTGYRDSDKDGIAEIDIPNEKLVTGNNFSVELHHAGSHGDVASVQNDKWSAGCQVTAKENDQVFIMNLVEKSKQYREDLFSYTLLNVNDFAVNS